MIMTSRERLMTAMRGGQPDCVPVCPDIWAMIPARLTGKPFWDIFLYQDPPRWEASILASKYFGIDGAVEVDIALEKETAGPRWQEAIVKRTPERIYTRHHATIDGVEHWSDTCEVYYIADPQTNGVPLAKVGLPEGAPTEWEDVQPRTHYTWEESFHKARELMGDAGVVGIWVGLPCIGQIPGIGQNPQGIYAYYDDPGRVRALAEQERERVLRRTRAALALKPDFILTGGSGMMIWNPEPILRDLALPTLKDVTRLCKEAGVISEVHCCGPERALVKIAAEETDLNCINPLEVRLMGDCDLAQLKREFGSKLCLKGNLHTTEVMLMGTRAEVETAAKKAIDDAAAGGGFILATGDQCGRDTPFENIFAVVEVARTYGRY